LQPFVGILIFSAIETATVAVWAEILFKTVLAHFEVTLETKIIATAVLFVGYVIEHIVAFNVGKGRPLLSFPRP